MFVFSQKNQRNQANAYKVSQQKGSILEMNL